HYRVRVLNHGRLLAKPFPQAHVVGCTSIIDAGGVLVRLAGAEIVSLRPVPFHAEWLFLPLLHHNRNVTTTDNPARDRKDVLEVRIWTALSVHPTMRSTRAAP